MEALRVEQLQNTNIVNICIPFRVPPNLFGRTVYCDVWGGHGKAAWSKRILIPRGAMSVTYQWDCTGVEPCRIWVEGQVGNAKTGRVEMYFAPVPRAVKVRMGHGRSAAYEWDPIVAVPPVTHYEVHYGGDLIVETTDCYAAVITGAARAPRVYAVNINGLSGA
jgi:hypothetical protein